MLALEFIYAVFYEVAPKGSSNAGRMASAEGMVSIALLPLAFALVRIVLGLVGGETPSSEHLVVLGRNIPGWPAVFALALSFLIGSYLYRRVHDEVLARFSELRIPESIPIRLLIVVALFAYSTILTFVALKHPILGLAACVSAIWIGSLILARCAWIR